MTEQQRNDELLKLGQTVKRLLPDYCGYVQFNLHKDRDVAILTKNETLIQGKT